MSTEIMTHMKVNILQVCKDVSILYIGERACITFKASALRRAVTTPLSWAYLYLTLYYCTRYPTYTVCSVEVLPIIIVFAVQMLTSQ